MTSTNFLDSGKKVETLNTGLNNTASVGKGPSIGKLGRAEGSNFTLETFKRPQYWFKQE